MPEKSISESALKISDELECDIMDTGKKKKMNSHVKGILCIIAAAFGFSLMTFFVRLSGDLPTMQKVFFRNAIAAVIVLIPILRSKEKFYVPKGNRVDILMRCLFGTSGVVANFYAIDRLPISDANMLNKLSPFFAILASIIVVKEIPSKLDILATLIAFIGALFIIRPSGGLEAVPALLGLYGGFGAGVAYTFVRKLGKKGERTNIIVFCFSVFSSLISLPFIIFAYQPMELGQFVCLILAGCSAAIGQFGITSAYKFAPAKEISVFDYTQVIFAAMLGFFFFAEIPETLSFVGYAIIIGVAVVRWNHLRKQD